MNDTMKAVQLHEFGDPEVLRYEDAPRAIAQPGEVLVRVHAASLNPPDLLLRDGYRALPPEWRPDARFPLTLGTDVSGEVVALGNGASRFSVGDKVYAMVRFPEDLMTGSGAYAEYIRIHETELALKPDGIDHVQAAGAPMSLLTVWQFLIDLGHDRPNPFQSFRHEPVPLQGKTVLVKTVLEVVWDIWRCRLPNGKVRASSRLPPVSMRACFASWALRSLSITKRRPLKTSQRMWIW